MNLPGDRQSGDASSDATDDASAASALAHHTSADGAADGKAPDATETTVNDPANTVAERRRLARQIAEGLLPESAGDERNWGDGDSAYGAAWYAENRPPHHDR